MRKSYKEYDKNRERKNHIHIMLDDAELIILDEKIKELKLKSRAEFFRQMIIYGEAYYIDYSELKEMNFQLGKIGNNINQIAHRVNSQTHVYDSDIKEIKELLKKIWQLQESTLSWQR